MAKEKKNKDDIFKKIFGNAHLFSMFIRDFVNEEWAKQVTAENVNLENKEFVDLRQGNKESDIVYTVHLKDREILILILLEHQSKVNFLMSFRMLEYMTKIWRAHIDRMDSNENNSLNSSQKDFKLPPIFPIVFYDGSNNWTAGKNFKDKVSNYESFEKFLPDFEYELIDLVGGITFKQLEQLSDEISLLLTFDKLKTPEDIEEAKKINKKVWENIKLHLKDSNILQIIGDAIRSFMQTIDASPEEIEEIIEILYEGKVEDMFEMAVHYSVREVREEEQKKWLSEKESLLNEKESLQRSWLTEKEEKEKYLADKKQLVRTLLELTDIETASKKTGLSVEEINELTGSK